MKTWPEFVLPAPVPGEAMMVISMSQLIAMLVNSDAKQAIRAVEKLPLLPLAMVLHCPKCHKQHIDKDEGAGMLAEDVASYGEPWRNPPHRSHLCAHCGCQWRPADVPTTGVESVATRGKHDTWPE